MLLSYTCTTVDFYLFYDGAAEMQIWAPLTKGQCRVSDPHVTIKALGPLVFSQTGRVSVLDRSQTLQLHRYRSHAWQLHVPVCTHIGLTWQLWQHMTAKNQTWQLCWHTKVKFDDSDYTFRGKKVTNDLETEVKPVDCIDTGQNYYYSDINYHIIYHHVKILTLMLRFFFPLFFLVIIMWRYFVIRSVDIWVNGSMYVVVLLGKRQAWLVMDDKRLWQKCHFVSRRRHGKGWHWTSSWVVRTTWPTIDRREC